MLQKRWNHLSRNATTRKTSAILYAGCALTEKDIDGGISYLCLVVTSTV